MPGRLSFVATSVGSAVIAQRLALNTRQSCLPAQQRDRSALSVPYRQQSLYGMHACMCWHNGPVRACAWCLQGWGLPLTDAMAMALPVIATNWSGPTEYLDEAVGYPLAYDLEQVPEREPPWFQGE